MDSFIFNLVSSRARTQRSTTRNMKLKRSGTNILYTQTQHRVQDIKVKMLGLSVQLES